MEHVKVRQLEDKVVIYIGTKAVELPWYAALEIAKAIKIQGERAEEYALAPKIAVETAMMWKAGLPIGFTDNPRIKDIAANEAAWNKDLRKYMGPEVRVNAQFGKPKLILTNRRTDNGKV